MKILENRIGIHAALTEFFFNQREMIAYKSKVEHKKPDYAKTPRITKPERSFSPPFGCAQGRLSTEVTEESKVKLTGESRRSKRQSTANRNAKAPSWYRTILVSSVISVPPW
jgi:hypothetical protein